MARKRNAPKSGLRVGAIPRNGGYTPVKKSHDPGRSERAAKAAAKTRGTKRKSKARQAGEAMAAKLDRENRKNRLYSGGI